VVSITTTPSTIHTIAIVGEVITQGTKSAALISLDGGTPFDAILLRDARNYWIHLPSGTAVLHEETSAGGKRDAFDTGSGSIVRSTIPGRVAAISVTEGAIVQQGDVMLVLDSMKMEHPIRAPIQGTISSLPCTVDAIVQSGSVLVIIDPE
jgi:biotin carboxyl carrier protein